MPLERADLLRLHWFMRLTRAIEDRTRALYNEGQIVGAVYTGAGMEATSVGAAYALAPGDVVAPLHRDLGAHLVRGTTPREVFCQWLGRGNAPTGGRDSRLHFGDMRRRLIVPATGIVGATLPVAVGTALAAKLRGEGRVTLAFIGDGGTSTGDFHEALNFAASVGVPFVCVVENNGYAYSTPTAIQTPLPSLAQRAAAYGIPSTSVDGNDALAVYDVAREAIEHARAGGGPSLIEARTFRMSGHSEADLAAYVPDDLLVAWAERDPIARFEAALLAGGTLTEDERAAILARVAAEVDDGVAFAQASPPPDPATLAIHVYSDDGTGAIKPRRLPETPAIAPLGVMPARELPPALPPPLPIADTSAPADVPAGPAERAAAADGVAGIVDAPDMAATQPIPLTGPNSIPLLVQRAGITHNFGDVAGDVVDASHGGGLSQLTDAPEAGDGAAGDPSAEPRELAVAASDPAIIEAAMPALEADAPAAARAEAAEPGADMSEPDTTAEELSAARPDTDKALVPVAAEPGASGGALEASRAEAVGS
jgi:TPP-dependent pyruvate/acetoin dehydrogenase alpha subunit